MCGWYQDQSHGDWAPVWPLCVTGPTLVLPMLANVIHKDNHDRNDINLVIARGCPEKLWQDCTNGNTA